MVRIARALAVYVEAAARMDGCGPCDPDEWHMRQADDGLPRAESRFRRTQKTRTEATVGPGPPLARRVSPLDRGA
ncbi:MULTISPECIES: hypothetical protein [Streptomyces]|uniref:hypothetical protein n=1 Tax=Streptomyces TaxID=1883 RepID=UPI00143A6C2E|nr:MULTISPECIES: hypothetical protein [unclassified Streptomyces]MDT0421156.1 hypothetical protein [Streptomyces sp. DSM 41859]NJA55269.1 hypothetical protein [Streptomyces sp. NEAU-H3]